MEIVSNIKSLLESGQTLSDIRNVLGISNRKLRKIMQEYNIQGRTTLYKEQNDHYLNIIKQRLSEFVKIDDISKELGISSTKIVRMMNKHNLKSNPKARDKNKPDKKTLVHDYETMPISEIAKKYSKSTSTIRSWFKDYNINVLKTSERYAKKHNIKLPTKEQLIKSFHEDKLTKKQILSKYNISDRQFGNLLKRYDIDNVGRQNYINWLNSNPGISYTGNIDRKLSENLNNKEWILENFPYKKYSYNDIADILKISTPTIRKRLKYHKIDKLYRPKQNRSRYETELCRLIEAFGIYDYYTNDRTIVKGYECDIYIPEFKLGIEFNGCYWHSDIVIKDDDYHYNKFIAFSNNDINLIQIYEYQWNNLLYKEKLIEHIKYSLNIIKKSPFIENLNDVIYWPNDLGLFNNKNFTKDTSYIPEKEYVWCNKHNIVNISDVCVDYDMRNYGYFKIYNSRHTKYYREL